MHEFTESMIGQKSKSTTVALYAKAASESMGFYQHAEETTDEGKTEKSKSCSYCIAEAKPGSARLTRVVKQRKNRRFSRIFR
jgi:hypothetical protein